MSARLGTTLATVTMAVALGALAGCGGGSSEDGGSGESSGRPSVEELSTGLQESGGDPAPTQEEADCVAGVLVDSGFSDETLRSLADGDEDLDGIESEEDLAALDTAGPQIVECYGLAP